MHTQQTPNSAGNSERNSDWDRLEDELKIWGRKLEELGNQSEKVGAGVVDELQARYRMLVTETEALKNKTDSEINDARRELEKMQAEAEAQSASMMETAKTNMQETADSARNMTEDMKKRSNETAEKMAESAQHLGSGFTRAWDELNKGFQRAYERLN